MRLKRTILGFSRMAVSLKIFRPEREFDGKRVAVVGAADSAFDEKNGGYIDGFDIVVRINKAPHSWSREKAKYIGSKFTYLFHSFYENDFSGGGALDWKLFDKLGVKKVVNPNTSAKGLRAHLNFYKRHKTKKKTYILAQRNYLNTTKNMQGFVPTVGYSALAAVLGTVCEEIFITGFTFFKSPYAKGYRKELEDPGTNQKHILAQGLHDPDLEFEQFQKAVRQSRCSNIKFDGELNKLMKNVTTKK